MAKDALEVALVVARALDRAGVAYFVGGSIASSFQGEPRATNDIDFVVDLAPDRIDPLIEGGEVSNQQWRDVIEVLRVSGARLDDAYLDTWADRLSIRAHLDRARREACAPMNE